MRKSTIDPIRDYSSTIVYEHKLDESVMHNKSDPAPFKKPEEIDVFDGLSASVKINYLVAMASNLSPMTNIGAKALGNTSIQEMRAIGLLVRLGPQTASKLAKLSRQDPANVSRTINKLVQRELVVKIPNPEHKRSPFIWVTNGGMSYYEQVAPLMVEKADQYVENFSEEEKSTLVALLERYIANAS